MRRRNSSPGTCRGGSLAPVLALLAVLSLWLVWPGSAAAQSDPDFLFDRPDLSLTVYGGWFVPRAGGDVFEATVRDFTVEAGDFQSGLVRGELAVRATERLDVALGVGHARSEVTSEYREFIGVDDLPILQTTTLSTVPITLTVKGYLKERGRSVSRFAWIPAGWSPWIGGGVGLVRYTFRQEGEFVDERTLDIFFDRLESQGMETSFHVATGADVTLTPRLVLTGDARYQWAGGEMSGDYEDFGIDLGGFQMSAGLSVRF